jgi:hypothetical protein
LRASFNDLQRLEALREEETRAALIEALVQPENDELLKVNFLGRAELSTSNNDTVPCLVLSPTSPQEDTSTDALVESLVMPITPAQLKLTSFVCQAKPLSKSVCLTLNPLLVNRDGSLFDNLPWSTWTIDPQLRNRDAALNNVLPKFHFGKRDAYNRFMGKDWKGRSVSLGNMAMRLQYMLEQDEKSDSTTTTNDSSSQAVLAKRVLDLQIRELEMDLAEWDYQVAVARNNAPDNLVKLEQSRHECQERMAQAKQALLDLNNQSSIQNDGLFQVLHKIANITTDQGKNASPYRGAMGYAPLLDTKDDIDESILPYTSPYDLLKEIISNQLNAQVIGTILENTSLMQGTLVLGGAVILRRKSAKKTMTINGEELSINDEDEDYGNDGIQGGEIYLVECDGDEAVGMSLACDVPIRIEQSIFARASMTTVAVPQKKESTDNVYDSIPVWEPVDKEMSLLVEGQGRNQTNREQTSPLFIPKTTTSLFDSMFDGSSDSALSSSSNMFPTDNPIQSLDEYDSLSNADKAQTLTMLSNFDGKLPRPRVLRQQEKNGGENLLDKLLLPLIDESVRRQYLIRDAEIRQDYDALEQLQSEKSRRQIAKEKAEQARNEGSDDVADWWENEADLYEGLRADITQDEGSYSRFLDKDEWYERDRLARAKRIKKSSFGTLLDGIE